MDSRNRPKKFKRWNALWSVWDSWLNDHQLTALEATLRYAVSMPELSKILVGVNNKEQLQQILSASNGVLPEVPTELFIDDIDLLNPSNWSTL